MEQPINMEIGKQSITNNAQLTLLSLEDVVPHSYFDLNYRWMSFLLSA